MNANIQITKAITLWKRMKGLLGKQGLKSDEALLISPCKQVHTFFMRFPIDVVFLDENSKIIAIEFLSPWKISKYHKKANSVLELKAGQVSYLKLEVGHVVSI